MNHGKLVLKKKFFEEQDIKIEWTSVKEGTGVMIHVNKLQSNEVDLIFELTEGLISDIADGFDRRLGGTCLQSPLVWSVTTGFKSSYNSVEDLKGETFSISRFKMIHI